MIGGFDIVLYGAPAEDEGAFIAFRLRDPGAWPDLMVQEASANAAVPADDDSVATMREFFIYRSRADFESWSEAGATEDNADAMIHVIIATDSTTLVTEPPPSQTYKFGAALRDAILVRRIVRALDAQDFPEGGGGQDYVIAFRELLSEILLERGAVDEVPPEETRRTDALAQCWREMTLVERDLIRALTAEPFGMAEGPANVALEDQDVERGQGLPPMHRAA